MQRGEKGSEGAGEGVDRGRGVQLKRGKPGRESKA